MNFLIVYDSLFGNTVIIARQIAEDFAKRQVSLIHPKEVAFDTGIPAARQKTF